MTVASKKVTFLDTERIRGGLSTTMVSLRLFQRPHLVPFRFQKVVHPDEQADEKTADHELETRDRRDSVCDVKHQGHEHADGKPGKEVRPEFSEGNRKERARTIRQERFRTGHGSVYTV